ncbi:MAG: hypothetical protein QM786_08475 [Breznakibacter sp.]
MGTIDELYNTIGSNIINSIKEPWREGILKIKVILNSVDFNLTYLDEDSTFKNVKLESAYSVSKAVKEIHSTMIDTKHRWNRAIFKVWPNNKFDMEFIWDQELHDEIERLSRE